MGCAIRIGHGYGDRAIRPQIAKGIGARLVFRKHYTSYRRRGDGEHEVRGRLILVVALPFRGGVGIGYGVIAHVAERLGDWFALLVGDGDLISAALYCQAVVIHYLEAALEVCAAISRAECVYRTCASFIFHLHHDGRVDVEGKRLLYGEVVVGVCGGNAQRVAVHLGAVSRTGIECAVQGEEHSGQFHAALCRCRYGNGDVARGQGRLTACKRACGYPAGDIQGDGVILNIVAACGEAYAYCGRVDCELPFAAAFRNGVVRVCGFKRYLGYGCGVGAGIDCLIIRNAVNRHQGVDIIESAFRRALGHACGGSLGGAVIGVSEVIACAVRPGDGYRLASDGEVVGRIFAQLIVAACVACRNGGGGGVRAGIYSLIIGDFGAVLRGYGNRYIHRVAGDDCAACPCGGGSDRRAVISVILGIGPHEAILRKGLGIDGVSQFKNISRVVAFIDGYGQLVACGVLDFAFRLGSYGEYAEFKGVLTVLHTRNGYVFGSEQRLRIDDFAVIDLAKACAFRSGQGERCFFYGEGVLVVCVDDCDIQPIALYVDTVFTGSYCICGVDSTIEAFLHLYFQLGLRHGGSIGAVVMESRDNIKVLKAVAVVDLIHALEIHFHRYIAVVKAETATRMPRLRRREVGCQRLVAGVINFNIGIYGRNFPSNGLTNFGSGQRSVFTIFPFNGYGEAGYRADGEEVCAVCLICVVIGGGFFIRNVDFIL